MKVGVYFPDAFPEIGGGFTFQDQIFQAFLQLSEKSRHSFLVAGAGKALPIQSKNVEYFSFKRDFLTRSLSKADRFVEAFQRRFSGQEARFQVEGVVEQLFRKAGVQYVWFPGPHKFSLQFPYLFTVWDLLHRQQPYFPEVSAIGEWERREEFLAKRIQRAAGVIAGLECEKTEIVQFYHVPPERIWVLPFPSLNCDKDAILQTASQTRSKYRLPDEYLFYPAQFWPHKNHVNLLEALAILKNESGITIPLVLTGSDKGNLAYVRDCVARLGLQEQVHFLGFVTREEVLHLYGMAFALVFPSLNGPDNIPPLEAFALDCPVISTDMPGAYEQLGDAAVLVNTKDPRAIAGAIKRLVYEPALRIELIQRGQTHAARWTVYDYVRGVFSIMDDFEAIRKCWP